MAITIVRLGSPRAEGEGLRLGTVRRPPRGVPKAEFASRDYYDVWMPLLSPDPETVKAWLNALDEATAAACRKHFIAQMKEPEAARLLDFLAALSHQTNFLGLLLRRPCALSSNGIARSLACARCGDRMTIRVLR
jgi:uncharacterized protein YeaO (DUF488 family)